ncbi:carbamoyltransferase family protein [Aquimarina latercula]|uniref:carbamoyltransferase family protein n=1 Tax=Aquimarina latercula TaxID=987 RepID=UPI0003FCC8E7|nr:carbamoyltransferase C-terminal domain-containing protein [Aquimarina latercula]
MKRQTILGISGGPNLVDWNVCKAVTPYNYHDSSAVLLVDGEIISAYEEERLSRIKHTNLFPINAIKKCLKSGNFSYNDIDYFTISTEEVHLDDVLKKFGYDLKGKKFIQLLLSDIFDQEIDSSKIKFYNHHYAHAATAYFQSGFKDSLVVTLDGMGDGISGSVYKGINGELEHYRTIQGADSLGSYYNYFTKFLGFKFFDEYKVMGLAPYGKSERFYSIFKEFYTLLPEGKYSINKENFKKLEEICEPRKAGQKVEQLHMDIAASLQKSLEEIVVHLISYFQRETGINYLCMSGGVALNCKLSGELLYNNFFKDIFVHPASADNGLSIGSALLCYHEENKKQEYSFSNLKDIYWGSDCENSNEIEKILKTWNDYINYEKKVDICQDVANSLAENKVIGWFQGKSEYGPRALGNRSILADPRPKENKSRVNAIIKMREGFRPFAPSILKDSVEEFFDIPNEEKKDYPFMTFILKVKEKYRSILGATTHIDGTSRIQTVCKKSNPKYWKLISKFNEITNIPILLNTSFNNNVEPIVDSAADAINCFLTNQLDVLAIDDFFITKKGNIFEQGGVFQISLPNHILLAESQENSYLHNTYWNNKIEISNKLKELITNKSVNIELLNNDTKNELNRHWMLRTLTLIPEK